MASTLRKRRLRRRKVRRQRLRRQNLRRRRMLLRKIPMEVWENVIDELQDDQNALFACARVCKEWTARSRHHLRRWVVLRRPDQVPRLAKLVRTGAWEVESCRTVRILDNKGESSRILGLFATMFAGKMPHLEALVMRGRQDWRWKLRDWKPRNMHADVSLHLSAFTSITSLTLFDVMFPSVQTFGRLLTALPSLTTLQCRFIRFDAHDLNVGALLRRPRKLATLRLCIGDRPTLHDISRWLVGTEMASTLKDITSDLHGSGIPALISSAGASLLVLHLTLPGTPADAELEMDLSQLVNLQHARFDIDGSADDWVPWLCHQLTTYPTSSTALCRLTLALGLLMTRNVDNAGLNATTCQQLDDTLSTPPFMSLKEVLLEFDSFNTAAWEELRQLLPARLPKLAARGILRFRTD